MLTQKEVDKMLDDLWRKELELTLKEELSKLPKECDCEIMLLMRLGCQCEGV